MKITLVGVIVICGVLIAAIVLIRSLRNDSPPDSKPNEPQ
jgi:hypothetical protein